MFLENLDDISLPDRPDQQAQRKQFHQDLSLLSEFLALRCCRTVFLILLFLLAAVISIGQTHTPVSLYGLICYFFVYLIVSEYTKKAETPEFSFPSLRLRYHYRYSRLLTERFSFWFSFLLLAALQYAFLYTVDLEQPLLTYTPPAIALLLLLLRYLTPPFLRKKLKRQVMYRH